MNGDYGRIPSATIPEAFIVEPELAEGFEVLVNAIVGLPDRYREGCSDSSSYDEDNALILHDAVRILK
jgi:hypothetical protein